MIIHYQNAKGEELFLKDIIHLQNIDNNTWEAVTQDNHLLTLKTNRIEAIMSDDLLQRWLVCL